MTTAAVTAVVAASGAGYAASTQSPEKAAFTLDAAALKSGQQQAQAAEDERAFQKKAAQTAEADRAARLEAQRKAEAEAARQAKLEAERKAEAERQAKLEAERKAAAERASRSAARDPKGAARALLGDYGWSSGQFSCLDALWERESGWDPSATNSSSGAYGIPQALPGSKMASAGGDWRSNPVTQIKWGLGYIQATYGSPCSALNHSDANGWY
jgi:hypothetical protein